MHIIRLFESSYAAYALAMSTAHSKFTGNMRGRGNLTVRKVYGKDRTQFLRGRTCAEEFSERKGTPPFGVRRREAKVLSARMGPD